MVKISGILKTSLIDYNEKVSYVVFFQGCNLACPWCSNFELIPQDSLDKQYINQEEVISYLESKYFMYDGVVLIGGEPTIQQGLEEFCKEIKERTGLLIKLDTNGLRPNVVKNLINKKLIDYVALDIKLITINNEKYLESKNFLTESNFPHEFRLTCVPIDITDENIEVILNQYPKKSTIYLQNFSNKKTLDKTIQKITPYSDEKLQSWVDTYSPSFPNLKLR